MKKLIIFRSTILKRKESFKTTLFFICLYTTSLLLHGCFMDSEAANKTKSKAASKNILRTPMVSDPSSLDPAFIDEPFSRQTYVNPVYECLLTYDKDNKLVGQLAKNWTVLPNKLAYIFNLHQGIKFHNGKEVTANDVKWSLERACNPKLASPTAETYLKYIVGASDMLDGKSNHLSGVQILDKYSVMISITNKLNYFLSMLTHPVSAIMPQGIASRSERITKLSQVIGSGPFKIADYIPNQFFSLKAFDDYRSGRPKLNEIFVKISSDRITNINKFKSKEFEFCYIPFTEVPNIRNDKKTGPLIRMCKNSSTTYFVLMPNAYKPFQDPFVRKAVTKAINRKYIVNELLKGSGVLLANSLIPPDAIPGYKKYANQLNAYTYNPDEARKLLSESSYAHNIQDYTLEILINEGSPTSALIADNIAIQLKNSLGMNVKRKSMEYSAYIQQANQEKSGVTLTTKYADYLDPSTYLRDLFHSQVGIHKKSYENPDFDHLVDAAIIADNQEDAYKKYYEAEKLLLEDAIMIPVIFPASAVLQQKYLKNLDTNAMGLMPFLDTSLDH